MAMRTFLAIVPPGDMAQDIHTVTASLRSAWKGVKWVYPRQYHITLAFLGERPKDQLDRLAEALPAVSANHRCFDIEFGGIGSFGSSGHPRLIYLEVSRGKAELTALRDHLIDVLKPLGIGVESAFHPHLSLGRPRRRGVRGPTDGALLPPDMKRDNVGTFRAREVILFESALKPEGPEYTVRASWPLKEAS